MNSHAFLTDEQLGAGQLRLLKDLASTEPVRRRKKRQWRVDLLHRLLVDRVRTGHYHDFLGPLDAPKTRLHEDLAEMGYYDLAGNCIEGRYDDEKPLLLPLGTLDEFTHVHAFDRAGGCACGAATKSGRGAR